MYQGKSVTLNINKINILRLYIDILHKIIYISYCVYAGDMTMTEDVIPLYDVEEMAPEEAALWMALILAESLKVGPDMAHEAVVMSAVLPLPAKECGHF